LIANWSNTSCTHTHKHTQSADELTSRRERAVALRTEVWLWLRMLKSMFVLLSNLKIRKVRKRDIYDEFITKYNWGIFYSTNYIIIVVYYNTTMPEFSTRNHTNTHMRAHVYGVFILVHAINIICMAEWPWNSIETGVCF